MRTTAFMAILGLVTGVAAAQQQPARGTQTTTPAPAAQAPARGTTPPAPAPAAQAPARGTTTPAPAAQAPARGTTTPAPSAQAPARGTTAPTTAPAAPARGTTPAPAQAPARGTAPAPAPAQTPARGAAPTPAATVAQTRPAPPPGPPYTYAAGGRRDPFRSLLARVQQNAQGPTGPAPIPPERIEGPKDMNVSDIQVKGVMQSGNTYLAMILGPNNKTYVVHPGDPLRNGTIQSITPQGLVIVQRIDDPLSTQRQREVRKLLRSFEEANK